MIVGPGCERCRALEHDNGVLRNAVVLALTALAALAARPSKPELPWIWVLCRPCGTQYRKPAVGGVVVENPGCPSCGSVGWEHKPIGRSSR